MILRSEIVEQTINLHEKDVFVKEILMTKGAHPLAIVRKRKKGIETRGALMMVHGFGQNHYTFHCSKRSMVNYLAREGWDVFNVDLRGHGRSRRFGSERPRYLDEYIRRDMPVFADELVKLSGFEKFFLVGHSMGGLIGYSVAGAELRSRIRGIVTMGSPYRFGQGSMKLRLLRDLASTIQFTGLFDNNPSLPVEEVGSHLHRRRAIWDMRHAPLPIRGWAPGSVEDDVLAEYLQKAFESTSMAVAMDIFISARRGWKSRDGMLDYSTSFEMLNRPLLVIAGTEDHIAPPASVKPAYDASRSLDKTYRTFPLGHIDLVMGREATATVWPLIRDWLNTRDRMEVPLSGEYRFET